MAGTFHWVIATAFILTYPLAYYIVLVLHSDRTAPLFRPLINLHFVLGMIVLFLVIPRLLWRIFNVEPEEAPGSRVEHILSKLAHWGLYALMIVMPLTGYLGTSGPPINFYLFEMTKFPNTALFQWLQLDWATFEPIVDVIHHFVGKWIAWFVVLLHIAAAFYHHFVRHDTVLIRMLPERVGNWLLAK
ncbi:cytochrome b [Rhizobiaceae bacterium BDR2-2]|uniref:Cytochrome b n=1 Tax=Ectorhizobium quercum TaxID=2965071 RepID=A0AAE3MZ03_9HYPH|nr:cytochrome b [Ectorhizobium quercum]